MPSITLHLGGSGQVANSSNASDTVPSFLPQQGVLPIPQTSSRSLFKSSTNARDPIERIIRDDAIAEALRSEEPLTDHDDSVGDEEFLLCLPRKNQANEIHSKTTMKKYPSNHVGFLVESPSHSSLVSSRSGSFSRRCSSLASSPAPTVFEEGSPIKKSCDLCGLNKCETSYDTFTTSSSLSDCNPSDLMSSPKCSRTKTLCATKDRLSVCSMLSTSSLCGLDIVHEASLGNQGSNKAHVLLQSNSSEYPASTGVFRPLRSELSLNSLGLSVDSTDVGPNQRDLFSPPVTGGLRTNTQISPRDLCTPPTVRGVRTSQQMLSPPPLQCRATTRLSYDAFPVWH